MIQKHEDNFLAKIAGETPIDDNPRNSTEFWLNEIAENLPGGGTKVIANPTLAGTEDSLTGLQVGDTKYLVPQAEKYYQHRIIIANAEWITGNTPTLVVGITIINQSNTEIKTFDKIYTELNKVIQSRKFTNASGFYKNNSDIYDLYGVEALNNNWYMLGINRASYTYYSGILPKTSLIINDYITDCTL